jgi:hypothetical protein
MYYYRLILFKIFSSIQNISIFHTFIQNQRLLLIKKTTHANQITNLQ